MELLLEGLDRGNDRHMALIVNHHRLTGRFEALSAELDRALAERPDYIFNVSKFAVAREVLDFSGHRTPRGADAHARCAVLRRADRRRTGVGASSGATTRR